MRQNAIIAIGAMLLALQPAMGALDAPKVLVLYNDASADSQQIANYYAQVHPGVHLLGLSGVSTAEEISAGAYLTTLRPQVVSYLNDAGAPDIQCIVTTKDLPLRINNSHANPGAYPGWRGDTFGIPISDDWWERYSSLESELTRVQDISSWEQMGDQAYFMSPPTFPYPTQHQASNPYYQAGASFDSASYEGMYLTSRLDGFAVADVTAAIDRAQQASHAGIIMDDDFDAPAASVDLMPQLSEAMGVERQIAAYECSNNAITDFDTPVGGYVSHGVNDGAGGLSSGYITDQFNFDLADGAVFQTYESYNAYSFEVGGDRAGQGLLAEWLAVGGTAGVGHVEEPGASSVTVANEDVFFQMLLDGYTWGEAAWASMRQLSFVNTVVGDPLMTWTRTPGDFDGNGLTTADDIDHLFAMLTGPGVPAVDPRYDLDGDGDADEDDMAILVTGYLDTAFGDFDLSKTVDATDLVRLAVNYGQSGGAGGWDRGDANGDGIFNAVDLSILAANFGFDNAGGPAGVPEPATIALLAVGGLIALRRRRT